VLSETVCNARVGSRNCCQFSCRYQLFYQLLLQLLHPFNGLFSWTTWVSRHQKGKPLWILLQQEMMGWQWHQLDHICTSLQTDNHASSSLLSLTGQMPCLPPNQQRRSTEGRLFHRLVDKILRHMQWLLTTGPWLSPITATSMCA